MMDMKDKYSIIITEIAGYYNQELKFNGGIHPKITALKEWMIDEIKEENLNSFKDVVYKRFDWFPKISELEKMRRGSPKVAAEKAWQLLVNKSSTDNVLITDINAFKVVSGFGDWHSFCMSRDNNKDWTHKDFLERYQMFMETKADEQSKVLLGSYAFHYGRTFTGIKTVIIGDKVVGKIFLEDCSKKSVEVSRLLDEIEIGSKID